MDRSARGFRGGNRASRGPNRAAPAALRVLALPTPPKRPPHSVLQVEEASRKQRDEQAKDEAEYKFKMLLAEKVRPAAAHTHAPCRLPTMPAPSVCLACLDPGAR